MSTKTDDSVAQARAEAGEVARFLSYAVLLVASLGLILVARAIPTSRFETLGAGAFPQMVFALIAVVAAVALVQSWRRLPSAAFGRFGTEATAWIRRRWLVLVTFLALGIYLWTLPIVGFSPTTFVFLLALQIILGPRTPTAIGIALVVAAVMSFGLNYLFAEVFNVFLPRGR